MRVIWLSVVNQTWNIPLSGVHADFDVENATVDHKDGIGIKAIGKQVLIDQSAGGGIAGMAEDDPRSPVVPASDGKGTATTGGSPSMGLEMICVP